MATKKLTVPDDGRTEHKIVGSRQWTQTFKNGSFGRCNQQQRKQQHQHKRSEHQYGGRVVKDPNSARPDAPVYSDHDTIVGHELVRQYYTVLYNAPEHLWRFYAERAHYCHVNANGLRVLVTGRPQVRGFLETTVEKGHSRRLVVIESVNTLRCAPDQLLVMATSEHFVQSFVVEFKAPSRFSVVASIVQQTLAARPPELAVDGRETNTGHVAGGHPLSEDRQVFVGHLSSSTTSEHLRRTFTKFGEVVDVRIMSDGYNRSGKPSKYHYAFVVFGRRESVDAVLASHLTRLCNGNKVNVKPSKSRLNFHEVYTASIDN